MCNDFLTICKLSYWKFSYNIPFFSSFRENKKFAVVLEKLRTFLRKFSYPLKCVQNFHTPWIILYIFRTP